MSVTVYPVRVTTRFSCAMLVTKGTDERYFRVLNEITACMMAVSASVRGGQFDRMGYECFGDLIRCQKVSDLSV